MKKKTKHARIGDAIEAEEDEVLVVVAVALRVDFHRPRERLLFVQMHEVLQVLLIAMREILHRPIVH